MENSKSETKEKKVKTVKVDRAENSSKAGESATPRNAIFNHRADDIYAATGVTEERLDELVNTLNEGIASDKVKKRSQVIEVIFKNTTHKELAVLFHRVHAQHSKQMHEQEMLEALGGLGALGRMLGRRGMR